MRAPASVVTSVAAPAGPRDFPEIITLLARHALPVADIESSRRLQFWTLRAPAGSAGSGELIGVAGLERFDDAGLLRSVAVDVRWRGHGLGGALVAAVEAAARAAGLPDLVLLTETAQPFFTALGYRVVERTAAPPALLGSSEFSSLCPTSAVCMIKSIESGGSRG